MSTNIVRRSDHFDDKQVRCNKTAENVIYNAECHARVVTHLPQLHQEMSHSGMVFTTPHFVRNLSVTIN